MRTCFLHIGVHKTGSTAIQHSLARHRKELRKHGLCVPRACSWSDTVAAHHNLAFELNQKSTFDPSKGDFQSLLDEIRNETSGNVLLTSEDLAFCVRHPDILSKLRKPLLDMGFSLTWIVYFRPFPEWAESAYTELAKTLHVREPFDRWVWSNPRPLTLGLDPNGLLQHIRKTSDTVLVRSYAQARKNLLDDFYTQIGVPTTILDSKDHDSRVNQRLSVFAMEYLMRIASHPALATPDETTRSTLTQHATEEWPKLPHGPSYKGLSPGLADALYQSTLPAYRRLVRDFRPDSTVEDMFPPPADCRLMTLDIHNPTAQERLNLYRSIADSLLSTPSRTTTP